MGVAMTATGPLPAIRDFAADEQRLRILDQMGARISGRFSRYHFPTADAVIDPERGVLFIAVDIEPDPADWSAVVGLIRAVGFTDGELPHRRDPGEPEFHGLEAVYTWRLEYVSLPDDSGCIWCDGNGCSGGCPLCGKGAVRLVLTTEPLALDLSLGPGALLRPPPASLIVTWYHEVMSNPGDVTTREGLPSFRSHSQVSTYLQCPRSYELAKVRRLKRRPGAWFPGGTAVHATIERYLREQLADEREGS